MADYVVMDPVRVVLMGLGDPNRRASPSHGWELQHHVVDDEEEYEPYEKVDAIVQTEDDRAIVRHSSQPLLAPLVSGLFYVNSAVHVLCYAGWMRHTVSTCDGGDVVSVVRAPYLYFSFLGLLVSTTVSCLPLAATVLIVMSRERVRQLRFLGSAIYATCSGVPLAGMDVYLIVRCFGLSVGWLTTAFLLSVASAVLVPWMFYLDFIVEVVNNYAYRYIRNLAARYTHLRSATQSSRG